MTHVVEQLARESAIRDQSWQLAKDRRDDIASLCEDGPRSPNDVASIQWCLFLLLCEINFRERTTTDENGVLVPREDDEQFHYDEI